jgi:hypothetical protein
LNFLTLKMPVLWNRPFHHSWLLSDPRLIWQPT